MRLAPDASGQISQRLARRRRLGSPTRAVQSPALLEARSHIVTSTVAFRGARPNVLRPRK